MIENCSDRPHVVCDGYRIAEWHPEPDGQGLPTQVHLVVDLPDDLGALVLVFKARAAVDILIGALETHRDGVWP